MSNEFSIIRHEAEDGSSSDVASTSIASDARPVEESNDNSTELNVIMEGEDGPSTSSGDGIVSVSQKDETTATNESPTSSAQRSRKRKREGKSTPSVSSPNKGKKRKGLPSISPSNPSSSHTVESDEEGTKPENCYKIQQSRHRRLKNFKSDSLEYKIPFNTENYENYIKEVGNMFLALQEILNSLIHELISNFDEQDRVLIEINSPGSMDRPIWVPMMRRDDIDFEQIKNAIERVQQSNQSIDLHDILNINIIRVQMPAGKGYVSDEEEDFLKRKKCVIKIQNKDKICLARALVTARALVDPRQTKLDQSCKKDLEEQERQAKELHKKAAVPEVGCGIEEVRKFQDVMKDYQIIVVPPPIYNDMPKYDLLYKGPEKPNKLYILYTRNHFHVINSMKALYDSCDYYCERCYKGNKTFGHHYCTNMCECCFNNTKDGCPFDCWKTCSDCNRHFKSADCFSRHLKIPQAMAGKKNQTPICKLVRRCETCGSTKKDQHKCGMTYCKTCRTHMEKGHQCYMQKRKRPLKTRTKGSNVYIYFDFECQQDELVKGGMSDADNAKGIKQSIDTLEQAPSTKHVPNYCVAQRVCGKCMADDFGDNECNYCSREEKVFKGEETVTEFCKWLLENHGATVIAHNMKGYDGHFILNYLQQMPNVTCNDIVVNGTKIMSLEIKSKKKGKSIKIIDSFNFIPMRLLDFAETFDLKEKKKGYFPHLFNSKKNENYIGAWPQEKYYSPDEMKQDDRDKFKQWYQQQTKPNFDLQKEIDQYCKSDVNLLRGGCAKFRDLFLDATGEDPFMLPKCITIASACMQVFQMHFLEENTIALIHEKGNGYGKKQSKIAIKWLTWKEHKEECKINHAWNGGEKKIGKYNVDGFCEKTSKVFEFNGCYWHGCPKCYPEREKAGPMGFDTMENAYQKYLDKKKYIEEFNSYEYELEEQWQCTFEKELETDKEMQCFIDRLSDIGPLDPRDAFYGGRTNATKLYHNIDEGSSDTIKYIDVCSLYPWVNKYGKYPIGHPQVSPGKPENINDYEGIIMCTILAPRDLYHPVLPYRCDGKLLFPLCATCAKEKSQTCEHSPEERQLRGTWVTDEVKKALEMGYELKEVHEVWDFGETRQYSPLENRGLFSDYVNTFLKIKQEADGWPADCKTEEDREQYIAEYKQKEGITLEDKRIERNPGKRTLAKLMLNSFWGKFGQRNNRTQTTLASNLEEYYEPLLNKRKVIQSIRFVRDNHVEVRWKFDDDFVETMPNTNIFIAAYTTAHARLKLYSYLEKLDRRVLYFDTDSIVYISKEGQYDPPIGRYLGDMTDELSKPYGEGSYIKEFVSAGPKNYACKIYNPIKGENFEMCKVKGFSLNCKAKELINFGKIKAMIDAKISDTSCKNGDELKVIKVPQYNITRPSLGQVISKHSMKSYRMIYDKRILKEGNDFITLPYGYKKVCSTTPKEDRN